MDDYPKYVLSKLNEDRLEKKCFCDFTVKTNSEEFLVHRCLLGSVSDFFKGMFSVNMSENYQNNCAVNNILPEIISAVIEFVYGISSSITIDNIYDVIEAADYLQISSLLEFCVQFLSKHTTTKNFFRTWEYAKRYNLVDLMNFCKTNAAEKFSMLSKRRECLALKPAAFQEFLESKNDLTTEEKVYETIVNWVSFDLENRETYFSKYFGMIDLDKISTSFLNMEISSNDLVSENPTTSKKLVQEMRKRMKSEASDQQRPANEENSIPSETVEFSIKKATVSTSNIPAYQPRAEPQSFEFVLVGGRTSSNYVRIYNVYSKQWESLCEMYGCCIDGQLIRYKNNILYFGGRPADELNSFRDVWSLSINQSVSWTECSNMNQKRHRFGCAIFKKQIYVAGGRAHKTEALASVESYLPSRNSWMERPEMNERRIGCCLIGYQNTLYALGGVDLERDSYSNQVEFLQGNWWSYGLQMRHRRSDFAVVVLNNKMYAIGGKSSDMWYNKSVETFYNGRWDVVAQLNWPRAGHGACVIGNKIYVVGGYNHKGPVKSIEVYYSDEDTWEVAGTIKGDAVGMALAAV